MTWVDLSSSFAFGSKLTSTQMQNLRDNIAAAFAKDSGAPVLANSYIVEAMMNSDSVDLNAVKDATGNSSGSLSAGTGTNLNTQDYSFSHNYYAATTGTNDVYLAPASSSSPSTYAHRFRLFNNGSGSRSYNFYYRYITATDEPFIFTLKDPDTGKVKFVWMADDPPPGYWGLDDEPTDFEWPVEPDEQNLIHQCSFKVAKEFIKELRDKSAKDKKELHKLMDEYEYDGHTSIWKKKVLGVI